MVEIPSLLGGRRWRANAGEAGGEVEATSTLRSQCAVWRGNTSNILKKTSGKLGAQCGRRSEK
jgi:hypothetical protein